MLITEDDLSTSVLITTERDEHHLCSELLLFLRGKSNFLLVTGKFLIYLNLFARGRKIAQHYDLSGQGGREQKNINVPFKY